MKRLLTFLGIFVLTFSVNAHALTRTATFGDKNASDVYRLRALFDSSGDTNGSSTNRGYVNFASDTGIIYPYRAYTVSNTPEQLYTADSGVTVTDFGGVAATTAAPATNGFGSLHRLPPGDATTSLGTLYTISVGSKCFVTVDTYSASDVIAYSISGTGLSAGDSIKSTGQAGDSVTLQLTSANVWTVVNMKGAFTDNN